MAATGAIAWTGARMTRAADRLADVTGLGEAIFGAVLLGGGTSLPGIVTSVTTAWEGHAELPVSNAIGGIAAQTAFLAVADLAYREANLEHAAASVENLMQAVLLTILLALPLVAFSTAPVAWLGVHPMSPTLVVVYVLGMRLVARAQDPPLWTPRITAQTRPDEPQEDSLRHSQSTLWLRFVLAGAVVGVAGWIVAQSAIELAVRTGISQTIVGGLFTAVSTSLPELVTSIWAVRRGALALAVGGIIGGNSFDVLFVSFADVAYRPGSIYHEMTLDQVFVVAVTMLLASILLLGLLRRQREGIAKIGFESALVLTVYVGGFLALILG